MLEGRDLLCMGDYFVAGVLGVHARGASWCNVGLSHARQAEDRPELGLADLGLRAAEHRRRAWVDLGLVDAFWADLG